VASEVLEHVGEVRSLVAEIGRVLRPGGLLWATTPHARGLSGRLLGAGWSLVAPPEHPQLFSLAGMRCLLHAGGFDRIAIAAEGANPRELLDRLRRHATRPHERVDSAHRLNAALAGRSGGRLIKRAANGLLSTTRLGDTLKVAARTPSDGRARAPVT
jgi:SAM-dependent methyltransferase